MESQNCSQRGHKIAGIDCPVEHYILPNTGTACQHPSSAREDVASTVMLEAVPSRIFVGIAAEIRQYK